MRGDELVMSSSAIADYQRRLREAPRIYAVCEVDGGQEWPTAFFSVRADRDTWFEAANKYWATRPKWSRPEYTKREWPIDAKKPEDFYMEAE